MMGLWKYAGFLRAASQGAGAGTFARAEMTPAGVPFSPILDGGGEAIDHPHLARLYNYWDDKRAGRAMPTRNDIDPMEIRSLLPHIALIDVEENPQRYRYRLVGTGLITVLGQELTGKYLDQTPMLFRRFAGNAYGEVLAKKTPTYTVFDTYIPMIRSVRYKRLLLPLSPDGEKVNMVAAGFFPF